MSRASERPSRHVLIIYVLIELFSLSISTAFASNVHIWGMGALTCKYWQDMRKETKIDSHYRLEQWVLGFMSGRAAAPSEQDILRTVDEEAISTAIDSRCALHPDEIIGAAANYVAHHPR